MPAKIILNSLSIPFVGSSRSKISGAVNSTFASPNRCCSPPDKSNGCLSSNSVNRQREITLDISSAVSFSVNLLKVQTSVKSSRTVFLTNNPLGFCGNRVILPSLSILPVLGLFIPQSNFNVVVFPAPLPPSREYHSPFFISIFNPLTTNGRFFSYLKETSLAFRTVSVPTKYSFLGTEVGITAFVYSVKKSLPSVTVKGQGKFVFSPAQTREGVGKKPRIRSSLLRICSQKCRVSSKQMILPLSITAIFSVNGKASSSLCSTSITVTPSSRLILERIFKNSADAIGSS